MPSATSASVKVRFACALLTPYNLITGVRKTLQAYTAPSASCIRKAAPAMTQRFGEEDWTDEFCMRDTSLFECHNRLTSNGDDASVKSTGEVRATRTMLR